MSDNDIRELSATEVDEVGGGLWYIWAAVLTGGFLIGYGGVSMADDFLNEKSVPKNSKDKGPGSGWDK